MFAEQSYITLHEKLREVAALYPKQIVVRSRKGDVVCSFTCLEFYQTVEKIAQFLIATCKIKCDDKVAIVLENRIEWGCLYFAVLLSGAIAVPIDPQSSVDDITFFCRDSGCKTIFTSAAFSKKVMESISSPEQITNIVILDSECDALHSKTATIISYAEVIASVEKDAHSNIIFPQRIPDNIASILYTSGTTGAYKGVMLTHKNFYANYLSIIELDFPVQNQHFLALLPLHHSFPFMATLLVPLFFQGTVTYLDSLKSDDLLRCLQQDAITVLVGVPQLFYMLYKPVATKIMQLHWLVRAPLFCLRELSWWLRYITNINCSKIIFASLHKTFGKQLQFLLSGGAKLDDEVALFFLKLGFNIIEGYGLTETAPLVAFNCDKIHKLHSAGKVVQNVNVAIERDGNKLFGNNNSGEIVVQGANVMLGYYHHEDATAAAIKDGWFHTGDIGHLDADGYLYITGRQKEILVLSSGKKILPEELELHYSKSRFIKEIAVTLAGSKTTEKLFAIVVADVEYCKQIGKVDVQDTIREELDILSRELPAYRRVMGFVVTADPLPRTRLGKIRRFLLQEKYGQLLLATSEKNTPSTLAQDSEVVATDEDLIILARPAAQQVLLILAKTIAASKMGKTPKLSDHLELDLGIESLARIELMVALEKTLNVKIADEELSKVATVRELIMMVETALNQQERKGLDGAATVLKSQPLNAQATTSTKQQSSAVWRDILALDLTPEMQNSILLKFNWWQRAVFNLSNAVLGVLLHAGWRVQVSGHSNLPKNTAFILAANHTSFLDGPIVATALPRFLRSETFFIGLSDFFVGTFLNKFIKIMKIIPLDPGAQLVSAMQACSYVLRHGKAICIFPEGGRSVDGKIKEFKKGVGILVAELDVFVVPVYISGAYEAWPRTARFPRLGKVSVVFGKPCSAQELQTIGAQLGASDAYTAIAQGVQLKVKEQERLNLAR